MRIAALVFAAALTLAEAARAADVPRAELFGGYSYMRDDGESFHGWNASFAYNLSGTLALVGDVSGHYGSAGDGGDLSSLSFLAGPRLSLRTGSLTPFAHALVGGVRTSAGVSVFGVSISASDTNLGGAFGGGIDLAVGRRWAVRLQGDYLMVRTEAAGGGKETTGNPRLSAGAVLRLGQR